MQEHETIWYELMSEDCGGIVFINEVGFLYKITSFCLSCFKLGIYTYRDAAENIKIQWKIGTVSLNGDVFAFFALYSNTLKSYPPSCMTYPHPYHNVPKFFQTDRSGQTVQTQIRLLLS